MHSKVEGLLLFNTGRMYILTFEYHKIYAAKGSLTFGSAGTVLPSHYYHFYTKKSAANARTTNCKGPFNSFAGITAVMPTTKRNSGLGITKTTRKSDCHCFDSLSP